MYGYGNGLSNVQSSAILGSFGIFMVLGFIAFVAAIVVTVLLYRKFVSDGTPRVSGKRDWRPFFRFETLLIDKILKAFYIFTSCLIAFESVAAIVAGLCSLIANPLGALAGIIVIAIGCIVLEVLNRLGFEQTMLMILVWRNTSDLRKGLVGDQSYGNAPSASVGNGAAQSSSYPAGARAGYSGATHPATPSAQSSSYGSSAASSAAWTCPSCGAANKAGSFCSQCGKRKPE